MLKNNKFISKLFYILGNIGIIAYLLGSILMSMFYLFDGPDEPFRYSDISGILLTLAFISILTGLCILLSKRKYLVGLVLIAFSTAFFCIWLKTPGDIRKAGIYSILLNLIIIISIVYNLIKNKYKVIL